MQLKLWQRKALGWLMLLAFFGALIGLNIWLIFWKDALKAHPVPPVNLSVPAKPAQEVKAETKVDKPIQAKTVKVYPAEVKAKTNLPPVVQANPVLEVIASNQVKADDHPQTITTLINTESGDSETYVRRDPLPWFETTSRGEVGLVLGLKNAEPAVRLEARQELFQVKAVHFGVTGSVDQQLNGAEKTDWFVGVGAWYRW
jgi:hypothetical protein